jgi:SNF2 family DNA or RNA helicase
MLQFALNLPTGRGNIYASPGTGKTGFGYEVFDTWRMFGNAKRLLVLGPLRVAKNVWPEEHKKWNESFGHLTIAAAVGTVDQRTAAVRSNPDILTCNYENIDWLIDGYGDDWPFDTVFADESTRLKGLRVWLKRQRNGTMSLQAQGSSRAAALSKIAHTKVRNWLNLTGSPAPNGLVDLWGQQWFIDGGQRLGTNYGGFEERWFYSRMSDGYSITKPHAHAQAEIENRIKDCSITIDARDYFDISEPIVSEKFVTLPPKARKAYDQMEKEFFALVESNPVEAFTTSGRMNKLLQLASGSVYHGKEGEWAVAHNEKIEMLRSLQEELNGEPLLVRYCFRPDKERILKEFPRAKFLDDQQSTIDAWNNGDIPMLVTHAKSAGHGLSLQHGGRVLIDFSSEHNFEHDEQILERIGPTRQFQSGYDRAVYRYRIVAKDTLEETAVLPALEFKMGVQESVKRAMKKHH